MDVDDIDTVVFERVCFGIKNFDLAIIFKDFTTFKRINSVPVEYIEELKSYFDDIDVIYAESEAPFNWNVLLNHIKDTFEDWIADGAWRFLQDNVSLKLCYTAESSLLGLISVVNDRDFDVG